MTRKILKKSTKKRNTDPVCKIHVFQVAEISISPNMTHIHEYRLLKTST